MAVFNKYKPVDRTPLTLSPPGAVIAGALVLAVALALFSPNTLRNQALYGSDLSDTTRGLWTWAANLAKASPLGALRKTLDAWAEPLKHSRVILAEDANLTPEPLTAAVPTSPAGSDQTLTWPLSVAPLKHRVLIVGASSIQYALGTELERSMREQLDVAVLREGKVSTGLSRPDVFDWPAEVDRLVESFRPDLVIGQFGGNDGQNIIDADGRPLAIYTKAWEHEYTRRIDDLTRRVTSKGADFVLLGMPNMRSDAFTRKIHWLNTLTQQAVQAAGGHYVDIEPISSTPSGGYLAQVELDGMSGRARMDDGIHFSRLGGQYVVRKLLPTLLARWPMARKVADNGVQAATLYTLTIPAGSGQPEHTALAWVPTGPDDARYPLLTLLHGADSSPLDFAQHADREIAQIAGERHIVIAMPDGLAHGWWLDAVAQPDHHLGTWLRESALPALATLLPVDHDAPRAIAGISMGGHGALLAALDAPKTFASVASLSGVMDLTHAADKPAINVLLGDSGADADVWHARSALSRLQANPHALDGTQLWLGIGTSDKHYADNQALDTLLTQAGVEHTWRPAPGGHDWKLWQSALPQMLRWSASTLQPMQAPPAQEAPLPPEASQ